ncbi:MAG: exo-alpha-sialidase, partial [Ktedonobacteraceae bacterium]|nr:exo-alpha-sialidase [Ktedonobacteraceae bacterium]
NTAYASDLKTAQAKNSEDSGISVSTSSDGGRSFGLPVSVFNDRTGRTFSDKPWMTVDQTRGAHSGTIYVVWSYDHGRSCGEAGFCQQELAFSRSTDGGKTFSPLRTIEGSAPFCTDDVPGRPKGSTICDEALGTIPIVEPDGTLVVAFGYVDQVPRAPTRLLVISSSDGGTTWTSPVQVARIHDIQGTFPPEKYRNESLPAFACDPRTGQLYLAWADKGKKDADILLTTSTDHGQTWSTPVRVNDDPLQNGANQFQPQLAVAPDGMVSVSFFDTRLDPKHRLIDVYLAQSTDFGSTFLKNIRVTTQSLNPALGAPIDENGLQFIGDYQGLAADNSFVHPFWNDMRTGRQEIFTAAIASARKNH